ncbi:O-antigen ligase domain-containing protein [Salinicoccus sp. HZC-1]|uniref:O-antigen ligase domain-containing protein n=1 Tax=Salinicoccus sp. HZC-1 TaxID=3385497 RepID=UPI00398B146F
MDIQWMRQKILSHEGLIFTLIFTLIFILTNLVMIDFKNMQRLVSNMDPFTILILAGIIAYLYKNSQVTFNKIKVLFLFVWGLYVISIFASMLIADHFVWTEAIVWILLTLMFLYKIPMELILYMTTAALLSLPSLLLSDITLNESGATLVLIYTAGLIFMPKTNKTMLFYVLPTFALLLLITTSRTAIAVYLFVTVVQFAYINLYKTDRRQRKTFLITMGALLMAPILIFFKPIYNFFINDSINSKGIDLNELTSGRYGPWKTVYDNKQWLGEGHDYVDFTELLHVHNVLFDTLGRYGIITAVLFIVLLLMIFLISIVSIKTFNLALFVSAFLMIGIFEYSYLFMFVYFSPVILFFVITGFLINKNINPKDFRHT